MAFPEDLVLVTVTGTILHPADGSPATGGVTSGCSAPERQRTGDGPSLVGLGPHTPRGGHP